MYATSKLDDDDLLQCLDAIVDLATFKASLSAEEQAAASHAELVNKYNEYVAAVHVARRRAYNKLSIMPGVPTMRTREFIDSKHLNTARDASVLWAFLLAGARATAASRGGCGAW